MKLRFNDAELNIQLNPGLYRFSGESASGKTMLLTMLRAYSQFDKSVSICAITYDENLYGLVPTKLKSQDWDIIMLDRLDMYFDSEICKALLELCGKSVVLLDIKDNTILQQIPTTYVNLEMEKDRIEVSV